MRLIKIDKDKYRIKDRGVISIDKNNFLDFDLSTKDLIDILPKFLEKTDKEYIYYNGDNPYLKSNYFVDKEGVVIIFSRPYRAYVASEFMESKNYLDFFKKRKNWVVDNDKKLYYDFYYIQGGNLIRDKSLWNIKSYLSNRPDRKSLDTTEKDNHYKLLSSELRKDFLLPQYKFTLSPKFDPEKLKGFIEDNGVTILKPTDGFGGKSIYVIENYNSFVKIIKDLKAIKRKDKWSNKKNRFNEGITKLYWVLEKYIDNPHLYKGKKYHFRVYYIITRKGDAYIYKRFRMAHALENYVKGDYNNSDIHDTHFIKRKEDKYVFLENFLKKEDFSKTLEACIILFNNISKNLKMKCYDNNIECFQIFACDLMLDKDLNLKLIELNTSPGFNPELNMAEEVIENVLYSIVDKIFPPSVDIKDPGHFIEVYSEKIINPRGLVYDTYEKEKEYVRQVALSWKKEGYGPASAKDRTGGYYLTCSPSADFHVHLVGPEGRYHPNSWSRKVKERRRWEKLDFRITPKETAFRIYVKSEFRNNPLCIKYKKN